MEDLISRSALMDDIQAAVDYGGMGGMVAGALKRYVKRVPAVDALPVDIVAQMLCDAIGDPCACNVNCNDEWLPYLCELQDACPHPCGVACWEQYLKYKDRKEETLKKYGFTLEAKYKEA